MTFALCPIVTLEKIAHHPAAGHMWLMELANGRTQVGSGSRFEAVQQLTATLTADEIARTGERS